VKKSNKSTEVIGELIIAAYAVGKIQVSLNPAKNSDYCTWRRTYIMRVFRWIILTVRNVSDESCAENKNTRFIFNNCLFFFFRKSCLLWDNVVKYVKSWTGHRWQYNVAYYNTGTAVAQWLRCCATNRKDAGSIPASVSGFFIYIKSFRTHCGPEVDSASNRNEYQEHFLGVKAAGV